MGYWKIGKLQNLFTTVPTLCPERDRVTAQLENNEIDVGKNVLFAYEFDQSHVPYSMLKNDIRYAKKWHTSSQ